MGSLLRLSKEWGAPKAGDEKVEDALEAHDAVEESPEMQTARRATYRDTSSHRVGPSAASGRARPVTGRATGGEAAYQRLARRTEEAQAEANLRTEALFDNVISEIRAMRQDVQKIDGKQTAFEGRLSDLELQVNMTRDEVQKRALNPAPSQIESAKTAIKASAKSPAGMVAAACLFITTLVVGGQNIPDALRFTERLWAFLTGREVKAIDVVIPRPTPPVSEK